MPGVTPEFTVQEHMARNYRDDPDLAFLGNVENADLEPLVMYIIGSHESPRFTEQLTLQDEYKQHGKNYQAYIKEIIHELQLYGGNSIANHIRGEIQRFENGRYADIFFSAKDGPFALLNSI